MCRECVCSQCVAPVSCLTLCVAGTSFFSLPFVCLMRWLPCDEIDVCECGHGHIGAARPNPCAGGVCVLLRINVSLFF